MACGHGDLGTLDQIPALYREPEDGGRESGPSPGADFAVYVVVRLWALGWGHRAIKLEVNTGIKVRDGYSVSTEFRSWVL